MILKFVMQLYAFFCNLLKRSGGFELIALEGVYPKKELNKNVDFLGKRTSPSDSLKGKLFS